MPPTATKQETQSMSQSIKTMLIK